MQTVERLRYIVYNSNDIENEVVQKFLSLNIPSLSYTDEHDCGRQIALLQRAGYDSKEVLILSRFKGRFFQLCPGSNGMICCRYRLLNTCFNCLYDCTYCYLNSYLNSFGIVQFTNVREILNELSAFHSENSGDMIYRIGTGEFTDSLMFDEITGIGKMLIEHAAPMKNVMIELKTKSNNIGHLVDIQNRGNAVLAWSMNTERNILEYESGSASLAERAAAARAAADAGYFVAFHFDPMLRYPGWEDEYRDVVDMLFREVNPERVVWISLGCFRYSPSFKDAMRRRFPGQSLTSEEMFPGTDGKMRYMKHVRRDIYSKMKMCIESHTDRPFIYLCMEGRDLWRQVFGRRYSDSDELELDFSRHIRDVFFSETV